MHRASLIKSISRAKQYSVEKIKKPEIDTTHDESLEESIRQSEAAKQHTEKIITHANAVVKADQNMSSTDKIKNKIHVDHIGNSMLMRPNNLENLGHILISAGNEMAFNQYGKALLLVGETEKKMGQKEKDFYIRSSANFIQPLKSFLDGQMKLIEKEVKHLELKKLDLNVAKSRVRKSNGSFMEEELERAKSDYERQVEFTKQSLSELGVAYKEHREYLKSFVNIQKEYHMNCVSLLEDLDVELNKEDQSKIN